jgi:recombinational DNA repair protein (RecF pathway)
MIRTRVKKTAQEMTAPEVYPTEAAAAELHDHGLHLENQTCARCGREIKPTDDARKTAKGDCVHMSC